MTKEKIIGIDLGGTHVRAAIVQHGQAGPVTSQRINAYADTATVLQQVFDNTDPLFTTAVKAIGIGFPGLAINGVAHDVYNIPSWTEVPLQQLMQQRYKVPVQINNDANCFALGEYYFGQGRGCNTMVGLAIGTGLGAGIILNQQLYSGKAGCAGEFGMMPYLDKFYEYYASGQFFNNVYHIDGNRVFENARAGDAAALHMYQQLGFHLGNAIKTIIYAVDPQLVILGGAVKNAYPYFKNALWQQVQTIELKKALQHFDIQVAELENSAILGAAALHYNL
jgi:glucokinase